MPEHGRWRALDAVLDAAERYASELLEQASKYERLNQPTVARETLDEHYTPLRRAIDEVRESKVPGGLAESLSDRVWEQPSPPAAR